MRHLLLAILLLSLRGFLLAQDTGRGNNTGGSSAAAQPFTIATLPPAAGNNGKIYWVSDATGASDCTTGGSNVLVACKSNGTGWFVASASGTPGVTTPATATVLGLVKIPAGSLSIDGAGNLTIPGSTFDPFGIANTNLTAAEAFSANASNLTSGLIPFARIPVGTSSTTVAAGNDSRFSALGTVTSLATPAVPTWLTASVSSATSVPAITIGTAGGQPANQVLVTPNGAAGAVGLRSLVPADIPTLPYSILTGTPTLATLGGTTLPAAIAGAPVQTVATRAGNVTLTHNDLTDWASSTSGFGGSPAFSALTGAPTDNAALVTAFGLGAKKSANGSDFASPSATLANLGAPSLAGDNTFAGTETFTLAPVFSNQAGTRSAMGINTFVASGASHTSGLVPDPGVTAGSTRFLREDSTFAVPPGGVPAFSTLTGVPGDNPSLTSALAGKQPTLAIGNLTEANSTVLTLIGGSGAVIGSGLSIQVKQASNSQPGYLLAADWTTFNSKQAALTFPLTVAQGGTGGGTASASFNALSPLTTLGDTLYGAASGSGNRLPGNITTTKQFMTQTGNGSNSATPAWNAIAAVDVPTLNQNTTGNAGNVTGTVLVANGGTGANTASAALAALGGTTLAAANAASPVQTVNTVSPVSGNIPLTATNIPYTATGGTQRTQASKNAEQLSVKDCGAVGDGSTDDTAVIATCETQAVTNNQMLYFPASTYKISSPLEITGSVNADVGATLKMVNGTTQAAVVRIGSSSVPTFQTWSNLTVDGNGQANVCFDFRQYKHITVTRLTGLNCQTVAFHLGDQTLTSPQFYEFIATQLHVNRTLSGDTIPAGSIGIFVDGATDAQISQAVIVDTDIGVKALNGGNFFTDVHVWSHPSRGQMTVGALDNGNGNFWKGFEADTILTYGMHLGGYNTIIQGCRFFTGNAYTTDNSATAMYFDQASPDAVLLGNVIVGGDVTHRWAADVGPTSVVSSAITFIGNKDSQVVTQNIATTRVPTAFQAVGNLTIGSGNLLFWGPKTKIGGAGNAGSATDGGTLLVQNNSGSGFGALALGFLNTGGVKLLNNNTALLDLKLGDESAYTSMNLLGATLQGGNLLFAADGVGNIGATAATRPANIYAQSTVRAAGGFVGSLYPGAFTGSSIKSSVDGNIQITNNAGSGFGCLQFGTTSATSPAWCVTNSTQLSVRTSDNSAPAAVSVGGFNPGIVSKTATYTATGTDHTVLCDATAATFTVNLPTTPVTGQVVILKKIDASANVCTLNGNGHNIDAGATAALSTQYSDIQVQYYAANTAWYKVN